MDRRDFLKQAGLAGAASALPSTIEAGQRSASPPSERDVWIGVMRRLADPVLNNASNGTLKAKMPVEQASGTDRRSVTHLEAVGRLLAGLAPWIELPSDETSEGRERAQYADLSRRAIASIVDPSSPDYLNFTRDRQPLVDAAFLAQGLLRAPHALRDRLSAVATRQLVAALESTRAIVPGFNNWLLFSATVEAGLKLLGANWDKTRVDYALRQHEQWYKGDGAYGDGPEYHWDYYNSFVIQPFLIDVVEGIGRVSDRWSSLRQGVRERARRYAEVQERLVAPDGSYPAIGRSIAYRCGAFQLLAQMALRHELPEAVSPAQARGALTAVIRRTLDAPGTFDAEGWLRIGLSGAQPHLAESYISTGSLYLCTVGFLPLGLPASDRFWSDPPAEWTSRRAWSGQDLPADHALKG